MNTPFPVVCFGETLWDILPDMKVPGGAPMNVAYHLQKLNHSPAVISKIGVDELGIELLEILKEKNIPTQFISKDSSQPTGKVYASFKENNEVVYDIVKPVAWDFIEWSEELDQLVANADMFVFGSLASRSDKSKETLFRLLQKAKTKVLDINLRAPHYSKTTLEELMAHADILKLNLDELILISGWFTDKADEQQRVKLIKDKYNIDTVIVTRGGQGALLNIGSAFYEHSGYKVTVKDTVGSGDAFLAGMLSKMIEKESPKDALDFASALGALIASYNGACSNYDTNEIKNLINNQ